MTSSVDKPSVLPGNSKCYFASDLHGHEDRYRKLFFAIKQERPMALFLGGDLFPSYLVTQSSSKSVNKDFVNDFLYSEFTNLKNDLAHDYPRVFLILGNDDLRSEEKEIAAGEGRDLWEYVHNRRAELYDFAVFGYSYVPPTPFRLKDWERYDVSRFVDPGCVSPEEGWRSVQIPEREMKFATIKEDLEQLVGSEILSKAILLFHAPPYQTKLDRAALDGKMVDNAPLDTHVGSIAIKRLIESRQPYVTLHGHVHESARITGAWKEKIGRTYAFSAAHDGPELALVRFDLKHPDTATRELV